MIILNGHGHVNWKLFFIPDGISKTRSNLAIQAEPQPRSSSHISISSRKNASHRNHSLEEKSPCLLTLEHACQKRPIVVGIPDKNPASYTSISRLRSLLPHTLPSFLLAYQAQITPTPKQAHKRKTIGFSRKTRPWYP